MGFKTVEMWDGEENEKLGPTGRFPDGKVSEHDQGELQFAVYHKDGKVIVEYGTSVTWVGLDPNSAINFGNALLKHARKVLKNKFNSN